MGCDDGNMRLGSEGLCARAGGVCTLCTPAAHGIPQFLPRGVEAVCQVLLLAPAGLSHRSSGQFPRPAALPVAGGCWMALGRGGGSTAIRVEGEAKNRPQPGNGLHVVFPTAMTPRVGSTGGQELLCLPPVGLWIPWESRSWETRSRVISAPCPAQGCTPSRVIT